jgi:hypothetical protein
VPVSGIGRNGDDMKTFAIFLVWCFLFLLCWPLAILVILVFPVIWLLALPFRLAYLVAEAALALIRAILLLPSRLLGLKN